MSHPKRILVTVGTTEFEALVQYTDSQEFLDIIAGIDQKQ
jgi:UDP-N-acetylglucosamine transferase subunit ALG13